VQLAEMDFFNKITPLDNLLDRKYKKNTRNIAAKTMPKESNKIY
jgi:vacuolar-type H+-ATPase subunit C/Vma6